METAALPAPVLWHRACSSEQRPSPGQSRRSPSPAEHASQQPSARQAPSGAGPSGKEARPSLQVFETDLSLCRASFSLSFLLFLIGCHRTVLCSPLSPRRCTVLLQAVPFESCPVPSVSCDRHWESDSGPIVRCPGRGVRLLVFRLLLVAVLADQHQAHQLCALVQRRAELVVSQGESVLNFDWSKS